MKMFCPTCDQEVQVAAAADRCPQCHKSLLQVADGGAAPKPAAGKGGWLLGGAVVCAMAAGVAIWQVKGRGEAPQGATPVAAAASATGDWLAKFKATDLKGDRAVPPGEAGATLSAFAKAAASDKALIEALRALEKPGGLQKVSLSQRRKHAVQNTADLYAAAAAGKGLPAHAVEAAWLWRAALQARGSAATFVIERKGVTTPLMLSRLRVGLKLADGTVATPFDAQPIAEPAALSDAEAAALWLIVRANVERLQGQFAQVYQDLAVAEALVPGYPAAGFVRGVAQLDQKLTDQGVATCEAALAKQPDVMALLFLAEVAMGQSQPVMALQRCEEALKQAPGLPEAQTTKAMVLLQRLQSLPADQREAASKEIGALLDSALKANPPPPGARAAKAQLLLIGNQSQEAENLLRDAVLSHKEVEAAVLLAELLRSRKANAEAAKVFAGVDAPLDDDRVVLAWVQALMADDKRDDALQLLEKAFAVAPESRTVGLLRAQLLAESGKIKESIAALEGIKEGDDGEQVAAMQAQLLLQDNQADRAVQILQGLRKKHADDKKIGLLLVVALARKGDLAGADALAAQLVQDKVAIAMELAEVWLQAQQMDRAVALLEKEAAAEKPDPKVAATLAVMYVMQGRKADALKLKERASKTMGAEAAEFAKAVDEAIAAAEEEKQRRGEAGLGDQPGAKIAP